MEKCAAGTVVGKIAEAPGGGLDALDPESEPETVLRHGTRYQVRRIILHDPLKAG